MALRVSVGASRGQILLASAGTSALIEMAGYIPRMETVRVDATVLAFTAAIAILSGLWRRVLVGQAIPPAT